MLHKILFIKYRCELKTELSKIKIILHIRARRRARALVYYYIFK